MNLSEMLVTMSQSSAGEQTNLFPFPFKAHVIFSCIALVFFLIQFAREKKPYQLIMAVAVPFSMVIWLSDSRNLFYAVGIVEAVLLIAAFLTAIIFKKNNADTDENNGSDEENSEETVSEEETDAEAFESDGESETEENTELPAQEE